MADMPKMKDLLWSKPVQILAEMLHIAIEKESSEYVENLEHYATNETMYYQKFRETLQKLITLRDRGVDGINEKDRKKILKACELYDMPRVVYASLTLCYYGFYKKDLIENAEIPDELAQGAVMRRAATRLNEGFLWHTGAEPLASLIIMSEDKREGERKASFMHLCSTLSRGLRSHEIDELFGFYTMWCSHSRDREQARKDFEASCEKLRGDFIDYEIRRLNSLCEKYGIREFGRALLWHAYWQHKGSKK